jgi:hypothetical protein
MPQTLIRPSPETVDGHGKTPYTHLAHENPCLIMNCNPLRFTEMVLNCNSS